jgi:cytochrome c-type biogenesis protein CcmH
MRAPARRDLAASCCRATHLGQPEGALFGCVVHGAFLIAAGLLPLAAGLLLSASAVLHAAPPASEETEQRVQAITDQLRCPTCQALSVKDSEAAFSVQIREKVERMVREGQSEDQIKAYFVSRYGEWILRAPPKEGLGLLLWALPFTAILAVGAVLAWGIARRSRSRRKSPIRAAQTNAPLTPEQRERVARDLKRFEEED